MQYKVVFFGRTKTTQVKCPHCGTWQFAYKKCCECNKELTDKADEQSPTEYRFEPSTWREKISEEKKLSIYTRDNFECQYCGIYCYDSFIQNEKSLTIDHLTPFSGAGSNKEDNLITCCRECNILKSDKRFKTFEEAREFILKKKKDYKDFHDIYEKL